MGVCKHGNYARHSQEHGTPPWLTCRATIQFPLGQIFLYLKDHCTDWLQQYPQFFTLPCIYLHLAAPYHTDARLGHVTCFGQGHSNKPDVKRSSLGLCHCPKNKPAGAGNKRFPQRELGYPGWRHSRPSSWLQTHEQLSSAKISQAQLR